MAAGPDVIVGDLYEVANWTSSAAIGGRRAYSVGTVSCNLGDTPLEWISSTNHHPVISGNMYRLRDGRFEQIGQSWLKHGFTALQGTVCGSCPNPDNTGRTLMPGCSDPYSASLNGSQSRLGPKSDVNASTGVFPYPYSTLSDSSATPIDLYKRLIVREADLVDDPNFTELYFVSSMYVAFDDTSASNNTNNESYRRINVANTGATPNYNISLASGSPTQRTKPAIAAWKDHGLGANVPDPGVYLASVDVPSDGRFWVGAKVTQISANRWHYEYAVENLTSHRSAARFSIPIPAGAIVENMGFHDVDYHSGEQDLYQGTDWSMTVTGGSIDFAAANPSVANANALRWDTLYNFRFDCNVPPAGGPATIGLYRTGTPSGVSVNTITPSSDGQPHPLNDSCSFAADVSAGTTTFSTVNGNTDGPTQTNCGTGTNPDQIFSDVWFRYTPTCTGTQTVSLCGSSFDTKLAVYATCPTTANSAIACNDDFACGSGTGLQSQLTFAGTAGTTYIIRVGGYNGASGDVTMNISGPNCGPVPPANDNCADAAWVAAGVEVTGSTALATPDGSVGCVTSTGGDVWYKYRPTTTGTVRVDTCSSSFDTVVSVHSGCGGTQLACNDDFNCGTGSSLQSSVSLTMTAGTTYWIRVGGYQNNTGNYKLHVTGGGGIVPPINDDCQNRAGIGLGASPFSTVGASTDGPTHAACNFFGNNQITNDIWYNYPSQCDGHLQISTCGTAAWDTKIAVYSGNNCVSLDTRLLACSDDDCGNQTDITIPVTAGSFYTLRVGGFNGATGTGTLVLTCIPPCIADYNNDGGVDGADVDAFFADWELGLFGADVNQDGGVDGTDIGVFFAAWELGSC